MVECVTGSFSTQISHVILSVFIYRNEVELTANYFDEYNSLVKV